MADEKTPVVQTEVSEGQLLTHQNINRALCGELVSIEEGKAVVSFTPQRETEADSYHLVHGGFTFGAADFAAMAAVNDPNVVLAEARVRFLAPVEVGKTVVFEAVSSHTSTRTCDVHVIGRMGEIKIFEGNFKAVVLDKHPLRLKLTD